MPNKKTGSAAAENDDVQEPNVQVVERKNRIRFVCSICRFGTFHRAKIENHIRGKHSSEPRFGKTQQRTD